MSLWNLNRLFVPVSFLVIHKSEFATPVPVLESPLEKNQFPPAVWNSKAAYLVVELLSVNLIIGLSP